MNEIKAENRSAPRRFYDFIEGGVTFYILGAIIVFICIFITAEVLARLILNHSFMGLVDIVEQGVVLITYLSLGLVQRERGHIFVDLIPERLEHRRSGPVLDCFLLALGILITALLMGESIWFWLKSCRDGGTTMTVFLPKWPFVLAMPVGFFFYLMRQVIQFKESLSKAIRFVPVVSERPSRGRKE